MDFVEEMRQDEVVRSGAHKFVEAILIYRAHDPAPWFAYLGEVIEAQLGPEALGVLVAVLDERKEKGSW